MSLHPLSSVYKNVLRMYQTDRSIYHQLNEVRDSGLDVYIELRDMQAQHLIELKKIVHEHGWPGKNLLGEEGAHMMWVLVQHCDNDVCFQERCRNLIKQAVKDGNATLQQHAFLTDRVLRNLKKKQRYGTQIQLKEGKLVPYPVKHPEKLDELRQKKGLGPFADYASLFLQFYPHASIGP